MMRERSGEDEYCLVRWLGKSGQSKECWVAAEGLTISKKAHIMAKIQAETFTCVDDETVNLESSCNTSKEKNLRKTKVAGVNILVFPCGYILGFDELFGSESLTQVLLPLAKLMQQPRMLDDIKVFVHDNACRMAAFIKNRSSDNEFMRKLSMIDMRVDRQHFKNHVGSICRTKHNPDTCPSLLGVNTSRMEQVSYRILTRD